MDNLLQRAGGDFDNRYSQRGVQWAVKQVAKAVRNYQRSSHAHTSPQLCHTFARRRHGYHDPQRPFGTSKY